MSKTQTVIEYLDKLTKDDLLCIIKYGLRGSNAPNDVDVEDIYENIYEKIGCQIPTAKARELALKNNVL